MKDLNALEPAFRVKVERVLELCKNDGHDLVPFFTLRTVQEQAQLWRQSRTSLEIKKAINKLEREGAPFLANALENVGPQYGRWATNALPGQSWHQHGEAVDCFVRAGNGRAVWSAQHPGYECYANHAKELGLTPGYLWVRRDAVHVQCRESSVRDAYTWPELDKMMKERFGS